MTRSRSLPRHKHGSAPSARSARIFAGQNPVDALAGVCLQFQEQIHGGRASAQLIIRKLCLADAQDLAELSLGEVKSPDLSDTAADGLEVGRDGDFLGHQNFLSHLPCTVITGIIPVMAVWPGPVGHARFSGCIFL